MQTAARQMTQVVPRRKRFCARYVWLVGTDPFFEIGIRLVWYICRNESVSLTANAFASVLSQRMPMTLCSLSADAFVSMFSLSRCLCLYVLSQPMPLPLCSLSADAFDSLFSLSRCLCLSVLFSADAFASLFSSRPMPLPLYSLSANAFASLFSLRRCLCLSILSQPMALSLCSLSADAFASLFSQRQEVRAADVGVHCRQ